MKILAIDTSSMVASAAVMDGQKLLAEYIVNHKRTHSEQLMPIIEKVLESSGTGIREIDAIAVASGPGSFTGLRIGAATAKGLPTPGASRLWEFPPLTAWPLICPTARVLSAR